MNKVVLDASAMLALFNQEEGHEIVSQSLDQAVMSTVNLSEVIAKLVDKNIPDYLIKEFISQLTVEIIPADPEQAVIAGLLRLQTKSFGLSLGDRFCIALGLQLNFPVMTADRAWERTNLGIEVRLIR
jgi:PIN domain nuclease of toxin-antitoxin system